MRLRVRCHFAFSPLSYLCSSLFAFLFPRVAWDPMAADRLASCAGDGTVRVWDARAPKAVQRLQAHTMEVLTCDWSKQEAHVLVTGSVDKGVRVWDLRRPLSPLHELHAHTYAVRRLRCSPRHAGLILSVSYDRSFALWDLSRLAHSADPLVDRQPLHAEFATGCDWSYFQEGLVSTCGWDNTVHLWTLGTTRPLR